VLFRMIYRRSKPSASGLDPEAVHFIPLIPTSEMTAAWTGLANEDRESTLVAMAIDLRWRSCSSHLAARFICTTAEMSSTRRCLSAMRSRRVERRSHSVSPADGPGQ